MNNIFHDIFSDIMEKSYHESKPWSFGNLERIKKEYDGVDKLTEKKIKIFLQNNDIYTKFKPHKKASKYSPIYVYTKRELFQADVVFFTNSEIVKQNFGYRYLFTCIDCFSKMAWVFPLKSNNCDSIMKSFKKIINICGKKPDRLNSDRGSELICKKFKEYLSSIGVFHYLSYSLRKCPIIERFNLTIQNILYRIMAKKNSYMWSKYLDQAMTIYLNRKHRTIGMSPLEAEHKKNEITVRKNLLNYFEKRFKTKVLTKFKINDKVRIWSQRKTFHRGYDENYSTEYFKIIKVKKNLPVPRYILQDSLGDVITGSFFQDELVKFTPKDTFEIEILNERKSGKKTEYFVHYIGYPNTMNEWVSKKKLITRK